MTVEVTTLGDWAKIAIRKHTKKMLSYEQQVLADRDPEDLHQMRVGTRRLRSALKGFAPALRVPDAIDTPTVARIARRLGKLRDLDVLLAYLRAACLPYLPPEERERLHMVLRALEKARKAARKDVRATLNGKLYRRFKKALQPWVRRPTLTAVAARPIVETLPDLLLPTIAQLLLHPGWLVGAQMAIAREIPSATDVEALLAADAEPVHDLRKEAKRARYQMELFAPFYGETYANWVRAIKEIQTILGELQDSSVAIARIVAVLGVNDLERELPTLARLLSEWRYRRWLQWQALQRFFLDPQQQRQLRACVAQPLLLEQPASTIKRVPQEVLS